MALSPFVLGDNGNLLTVFFLQTAKFFHFILTQGTAGYKPAVPCRIRFLYISFVWPFRPEYVSAPCFHPKFPLPEDREVD